MTSPYRVLQVAKQILEEKDFCLYNDPRFKSTGYARTSAGEYTDPANNSARQFTLMGALARAAFDLSGNWITGHGGECFDKALNMLMKRTNFNHYVFFRYCDKLGKEGCIKLIEETLE